MFFFGEETLMADPYYTTLVGAAKEVAKTMGHMWPVKEAIAVVIEDNTFSIELVDLSDAQPLHILAECRGGQEIKPKHLKKGIGSLPARDGQTLNAFAFKLVTLESGRQHWVHYDIGLMRPRALCGRTICSEPFEG